jgi:hypothetical protein
MTAKKAFWYYGVAVSLVVTISSPWHDFFAASGSHAMSLGESIISLLCMYTFLGIGAIIGSRLDPMMVRVPSLILAALYAIAGIAICFSIPRFLNIYVDIVGDSSLPGITTAILMPRPIGWVLIGFVCAGAVLAKDKSTHSRSLNIVLFVAFVCVIAITMVALYLPIVREFHRTSSQ